MISGPQRLKSVGLHYKPRWVAMKQKTVRQVVTLHKRRVRHAAREFLRSGSRGAWNRMHSMITNWDFD